MVEGNSTLTNRLEKAVIHSLLTLLSLVILVPIFLIVGISLTEEKTLLTNGFKLIPEKIDFSAYSVVLKSSGVLLQAYGVTILVTIVGSVVGLLLTSLTAYVISRKDFRYNKIMTLYVFFTMLFSGGLVPLYIMVTQYLHLKDSIWSLIIPYLLNPFYVMIMKGFLDKIPGEVIESAKIDGASEWRIFIKLVLPLATPALATVGLFISFTYWNDWWLGLLFIDNPKLVPLQLLLYRIISSIDFLSNNVDLVGSGIDMSDFPNLSARMAMAVLAAGPMMFVFPFFQKYFVRGLTVGSIKG